MLEMRVPKTMIYVNNHSMKSRQFGPKATQEKKRIFVTLDKGLSYFIRAGLPGWIPRSLLRGCLLRWFIRNTGWRWERRSRPTANGCARCRPIPCGSAQDRKKETPRRARGLDSLHTKVQEFLLLFPVASRMIIGHLFQIASRFFDFFSQAVSR